MSDVDLKDLVSRKVDEAKWPPPLPAGTYFGVVQSFKFGNLPWKNQDGTDIPGCTVMYKITGAESSLADELGDLDPTKKALSSQFRLTPGEDAPLGDFVRSLLGESGTAGRSWGETLPDCVGKEVMLEVTKDLNKKKPDEPARNNVKRAVARPAD